MKRNGAWHVAAGLGFAVLLGTGVMTASSAIRHTSIRHAPPVAIAPRGAWTAPLATVDRALAKGDVSGALRAWHHAYAVALHDPAPEGLIAVGEARLRIERKAGTPKVGVEQARQLYAMALFRARDQQSAPASLRAAAAFEAVGDHEMAARAVRVAGAITPPALASADPLF